MRKIDYEIVIFMVLMLQAVMIINWTQPVPDVCLPFYVIDYHAGFASRMFIGSIVELLTDHITLTWLTGFTTISLAITFFIAALLLGKLIRTVNVSIKNLTLFCVFICLLTSYSIASYAHILGMLDLYWCLCALLIVLFIDNKLLKWLIPVLCFIGLATQYLFAFIFVPIIVMMLLYKLYSKVSAGNIVLVSMTIFVCLASSVYFFFFANDTMLLNKDELYNYMSGKVSFVLQREYFDFNLYNYGKGEYHGGLLNYIKIYFGTSLSFRSITDSVINNIYIVPFMGFFVYIWTRLSKGACSRVEKYYYRLCAVLPLISTPVFILSTDTERFIFQVTLTQFMLLFFLIYNKNETVISVLKNIQDLFYKKYIIFMLFAVFALSAAFIHSIY